MHLFQDFDCFADTAIHFFLTQNLHYCAEIWGIGSAGYSQTDYAADVTNMAFELFWIFLVILWFAGIAQALAHAANFIASLFAEGNKAKEEAIAEGESPIALFLELQPVSSSKSKTNGNRHLLTFII